jgi:hypothetical protein
MSKQELAKFDRFRDYTEDELSAYLEKLDKRVTRDKEDVKAFENAIRKSPRLKSITVLYGVPEDFDNVEPDPGQTKAFQGAKELTVIHEALRKTSTKIRTLTVKILDSAYFIMAPPKNIVEAWKSLKILDLQLLPSSRPILESMKQILRQFEQLQTLSLQFATNYEYDSPHLYWIMDEACSWPVLSKLTLFGFAYAHGNLSSVITNNTSIKHLYLGDSNLQEPGSWETEFAEIRKLGLNGIHVWGLLQQQTNKLLWADDGLFRQLEQWVIEGSKSQAPYPLNSENSEAD